MLHADASWPKRYKHPSIIQCLKQSINVNFGNKYQTDKDKLKKKKITKSFHYLYRSSSTRIHARRIGVPRDWHNDDASWGEIWTNAVRGRYLTKSKVKTEQTIVYIINYIVLANVIWHWKQRRELLCDVSHCQIIMTAYGRRPIWFFILNVYLSGCLCSCVPWGTGLVILCVNIKVYPPSCIKVCTHEVV